MASPVYKYRNTIPLICPPNSDLFLLIYLRDALFPLTAHNHLAHWLTAGFLIQTHFSSIRSLVIDQMSDHVANEEPNV